MTAQTTDPGGASTMTNDVPPDWDWDPRHGIHSKTLDVADDEMAAWFNNLGETVEHQGWNMLVVSLDRRGDGAWDVTLIPTGPPISESEL